MLSSGGLAASSQYGPYLGADGYCHYENATGGHPTVSISGYANVTVGDVTALEEALATRGPIAISIDASKPTFSFYSHGVYSEPTCSTTDLDHTVLAVGYGTSSDGKPYVIVKNSWSTHWGDVRACCCPPSPYPLPRCPSDSLSLLGRPRPSLPPTSRPATGGLRVLRRHAEHVRHGDGRALCAAPVGWADANQCV